MHKQEENNQQVIIPLEHAGLRLDKSLATLFPEYSRAKIQSWINAQQVTIDGQFQSTRYSVCGGEKVILSVIHEDQIASHQAENIPLSILYEDQHLIVINKSVGLVVHPGAGNHHGTLLNALLNHHSEQVKLPRAGIVHRLDKDTSGIMVVAKSLVAHTELTKMLQEREIERKYYAVVRGQLISGGSIDAPIGRHPNDRIKMAINERGKPACTHFKIMEKFKRHTWLDVKLDTGRTHQIRVHFSANKHPLVGDTVYAPRIQRVANIPDELNVFLSQFPRQALHAYQLSFTHPVTNEALCLQAPIPDDLQSLLDNLREYSAI